jgi:hypothetical protein
MGSHEETYGFYTVEKFTTFPNNAIDKLTSFPNLCSGLCRAIDGEILQFVGAFDVYIGTHPYVFDDPRILDHGAVSDLAIVSPLFVKLFFGECQKAVEHLLIIPEFGPHKGITGQHAIERDDFPSGIFIADLQPDPDVFRFSLLDDTITKLGHACCSQFIHIYDHHIIS